MSELNPRLLHVGNNPVTSIPMTPGLIPIDTLKFIIIILGLAPDSIVLVSQRSPQNISSFIYLARVYKDPLLVKCPLGQKYFLLRHL